MCHGLPSPTCSRGSAPRQRVAAQRRRRLRQAEVVAQRRCRHRAAPGLRDRRAPAYRSGPATPRRSARRCWRPSAASRPGEVSCSRMRLMRCVLRREVVDAIVEAFPLERRLHRVRRGDPASACSNRDSYAVAAGPLIGLHERRQRVEQARDHPLRDRLHVPRLSASDRRRPARAPSARRRARRWRASRARVRGSRAPPERR